MGKVKTDLVVVQGNLSTKHYVNLLNNNLPFMQNFGPGLTFQHDNTRPHIALVTANFLACDRFTLAGFIPGYESYRAHFGMGLVEELGPITRQTICKTKHRLFSWNGRQFLTF